jgi:tetratricopeptide (TPR) repeat protein
MQMPLRRPAERFLFLGSVLLAATFYIGFVSIQYWAAYLAGSHNLANRQFAIRLQPGNADYRYRMGRYFFQAGDWPEAAENYRAAVTVNPHLSEYWLGLASSYKFLGKWADQQDALNHAKAADPTTPDVAWEAADLYLTSGNINRAMSEFRVVLENSPYRTPFALDLCWRIKPDVDLLLRDVIPPIGSVYSSFLELLIAKKEMNAAAAVWARSVKLDQPIERRYAFGYMRFLVEQGDIIEARNVWQQAAKLSDLAGYQPSPENLVVNGEFSLPVLDAGFDWRYEKHPYVSLSLDSIQSHMGPHSLLISFEGGPIENAGIRQLVPIAPNTTYEFSADFKSQNLEGAGGPQFVVDDFYGGSTYFTSEKLTNTDIWKQVSGRFTTGAQAKLLMIQVKKNPPGTVTRGKLWIDDVRLVQAVQSGHSL